MSDEIDDLFSDMKTEVEKKPEPEVKETPKEEKKPEKKKKEDKKKKKEEPKEEKKEESKEDNLDFLGTESTTEEKPAEEKKTEITTEQQSTEQPIETSTEPIETSTEPIETSTEPIETSTEPIETSTVQQPVPTVQPQTFDLTTIDSKQSITTPTSNTFISAYDGIPKEFLVDLMGKPYICKAGLIWLAKKIGLKSIYTEPICNSWENKTNAAKYKAIVTLENGSSFVSHGIAIPDGKNVQMRTLFAFVDHLAETRAICRALRLATNCGFVSYEEMSQYKGEDLSG